MGRNVSVALLEPTRQPFRLGTIFKGLVLDLLRLGDNTCTWVAKHTCTFKSLKIVFVYSWNVDT